ncbi:MAG: glycosyltransferase family 4 protein [Candidatus Binatia bacterium]
MKLTVVWHKPFWSSPHSPTGFASRGCLGHPGFGGLPRQVEALSELFDATRIVGPCSRTNDQSGETAIAGNNVSVVALTWLPRSPWVTWLVLPFWLARNGLKLTQEISSADAVFPFIPSPIGIIGLVLTLIFRKSLLTRQLNNWSESRLLWRLERALLERIAGGKNVVFATGISEEPPSTRNHAIRWIFSTTVSERELAANAVPRSPARAPHARLIIVGREAETKETLVVLRALPLLACEFPNVTLDVVGDFAVLSQLEHVAKDLKVVDRVTFHGSPNHQRVIELLRQADLFCCLPAAETESFRQAVHEALACGLPVVTARTSIAPMLMRNGCGIILQEGTSEALAAAVTACLSDPERYRNMSIEALRTARAYSLEQWREIVRSALEKAWGPLQSDQWELRKRQEEVRLR